MTNVDAPPLGPAERYIDLLTTALLRELGGERYRAPQPTTPTRRFLARAAERLLAPLGLALVRPVDIDPRARESGRYLPPDAETMIGRCRMDHIARCLRDVLERDVPGDVIECGVWRGGATILMRGVLAAYGVTDRVVWVADSFAGLPPAGGTVASASATGDTHAPDAGRGLDRRDAVAERTLAVPLETVRANFARFGLLDEQVRFLPGWFADTLPSAPIAALAVLRVDADLYGSTLDALEALYPRLSAGGGWCIIDDYGDAAGCRVAVDTYREAHGIGALLEVIDHTAVAWRKEEA
ncbi:MAG: TylF/MycF/NovP-related O-methyltransferase [Anaerolineae bacterium]